MHEQAHLPEQGGLFDAQVHPVAVGDTVTVQAIWGDEPGVVKELELGLATVDLERGDTIKISVARLVRADGDDDA